MDVELVVTPPSTGQSDAGSEFSNALNSPAADHEVALFRAEVGKLEAAQREFTADFYRQEAARNAESHKRVMDFLLTQERINGASVQQEQLNRVDGGNAPTDPNGRLNPNARTGAAAPTAGKRS